MQLNTAKASPETLLSAARNLASKGQYADAVHYLSVVLQKDAGNHAAMALMGQAFAAQSQVAQAVEFYTAAIRAAPEETPYRQGLLNIFDSQRALTYNKAIEDAFAECLAAEGIDCTHVFVFWFEHLVLNPAFDKAFGLKSWKFFDPANRAAFEKITDFSPVFTPIFLRGLKYMFVTHPVFEEFLTHLRRRLLENKFDKKESLMLAPPLAHYCFNTDFIFDDTPAEQAAVDALRKKIESGQGDARDIAVLACYAPLCALSNANDILQQFSASDLAGVVKAQIADYNALRERAASIPVLTPISEGVSSDVRAQYEEFPYPRWRALSAGVIPEGREAVEGHTIFKDLRGKKAKILNAGCGTGQEALMITSHFPKAEVLGIDLSRTSLAYAAGKAEEYGIENISFGQADIMQLGTLDQKFDYIASAGVLHHLKDPVAGWRVLTGLLRPNGFMTVGLYSKIARRHILAMQKLGQEKGYARTAEGMKSFRRDSPRLAPPEALEGCAHFMDYYSLNMYRDLLFHVQEYDYDLTEVAAMLDELGLEFLGFVLDAPIMDLYQQRFPSDPRRVDLANWHVFEQENPDLFKYMYQFWCRKKKSA